MIGNLATWNRKYKELQAEVARLKKENADETALMVDTNAKLIAQRDAARADAACLAAELEAYRKAKAENDERFMLERDAARADAACLREALALHGRHADDCPAAYLSSTEPIPCMCGLSAALEGKP